MLMLIQSSVALSYPLQDKYFSESPYSFSSLKGAKLVFDDYRNLPNMIIKDGKKYYKDDGDVFYIEDKFTGEKDYSVRYILWSSRAQIFKTPRANIHLCLLESRLPQEYRDKLQARLNEFKDALLQLDVHYQEQAGIKKAKKILVSKPNIATLKYCKEENRFFSDKSSRGINGFSFLRTDFKDKPTNVTRVKK
jgi:hypothetical protein